MKSNNLNFKEVPFSRLIREVDEPSELRSEYADRPAEERRLAADLQYHSSIAQHLFDEAIGRNIEEIQKWPSEILALVIDPTYAPALLTVGSYEYIYWRKDEAMIHFLALTNLPEETEDLCEIIEKAADFLIDNQDFENAIRLYSSAIDKYPNNADFHNGLSYCYEKLGNFSKAIEEARICVDLDPENYRYLTDLGWTLVEAKEYDEAQTVLEKAVDLSPLDYDLARKNLEELHRRKNM
jgi:tetratricopeptide (TPR) repeat protein